MLLQQENDEVAESGVIIALTYTLVLTKERAILSCLKDTRALSMNCTTLKMI